MIVTPLMLLVTVTALISALNPYTIGVLILLCSVVYGGGRASRHVLGLGLVYTLTLFGTLLLSGITLLYLFSLLSTIAAAYLTLGIGILVECAALLEIKDFLWYGEGLSAGVPHLAVQSVKTLTKNHPGLRAAVVLGMFVAVVSAPGNWAPYFATLTALQSHFDATGIGLVTLYSGIFAFPMLILLILIVNGVRVSTLQRWKKKTKGSMRLATGLLLIPLGWILILMAGGIINLN